MLAQHPVTLRLNKPPVFTPKPRERTRDKQYSASINTSCKTDLDTDLFSTKSCRSLIHQERYRLKLYRTEYRSITFGEGERRRIDPVDGTTPY